MSKGTILMVEDDAILAIHLQETLAILGYTVLKPMTSGEDAVAAAEWFLPDLILMDIELAGEMNGIEAAEIIRVKTGIPVIFLTGRPQDPLLRQASETAPYAYLVKPVPERELAASIELALYRSGLDRKLKESEERFRLLFESMSSGFALHEIILDPEGNPCDYRFLEVNPAFEAITGFKAGDLVGRTLLEALPDADRSRIEIYGRVALTGESNRFEVYIGELGKYGEVTAYSPKYGQFATIFQDVTERKRAEDALRKSEDRYLSLIRNMDNAFADHRIILDEQGKPADFLYLEINDAYERIAGVTREQVIGKRESEITPSFREERFDWLGVYGKVALEGNPVRFEGFSDELGKWFAVSSYRSAPGHFVTNFFDISDRKRAEEQLWETLRLNKILMDNFPCVALLLRPSSREIVVSNDMAVQVGAIPGCTCYGTWGQRDDPCPWCLAPEVWATGQAQRVEVEAGGIVWDAHWIPIDEDLYMHFAFDITDRKHAEVALRTSEEKYRAVVENSHEIILVAQEERLVFANQTMTNTLGFSNAELTSGSFTKLIHPDDREMVRSRHLARLKGEAVPNRYPFRVLRKNGEIVWFEISAVVITWEGKPATLNFMTDITERKQAEGSLRESEERYREVFSNTHDGIFIIGVEPGPRFRYLDFNPAEERFIALDAADLSGRYVEDVVGFALGEIVTANYSRCLETAAALHYEEVLDLPRGRMHFYTTLIPVKDAMGEVYRIVGVSHDITERKRAELALRESEQKFAQLVEQSPISIEVYSADGMLINANRAYEDLWRIPKDVVIGKYNILQHQHARNLKIIHFIEKAFRGESVRLPLLEHDPDSTGDFPTSRKRFVQPYIYPIINERGAVSHVVLIIIDVSEQKQLELQLLQAQKMETIGRLAGGVAHDFNNILTVINANAELELMLMKPEDPHYEIFEEIRKAGERAANLTRQLLAFSRRQIIEPLVINLNKTLLEMDKMLRRLIGEHIELVTIPDESLWPVKVDPGQIEQVLTNLVVNARDAMPRGGRLTIETRNAELDEEYVRNHPDTVPGNYVMFSVSDTGTGMDEETLSHLFEPFFTTKPKGSGTGLGLSTCYGIVKQNNGGIWVYSEPGRGSTIKVYLPAIEDASLYPVNPLHHASLPSGTETVLVVEDDSGILLMITRHLASSGYRVLTASNGEEAIAMVQKYPDPIHLLITDIIMPFMGGKELAERLAVIYPGLRIMFMSGYTDNSIVRHGVLEPGVKFIQKPFSMVDFMRKIREALET